MWPTARMPSWLIQIEWDAHQCRRVSIGALSGPHGNQSNQILAPPIGVGTPRRNTSGTAAVAVIKPLVIL